jgi:predicted nuclease with TOPRIM domain
MSDGTLETVVKKMRDEVNEMNALISHTSEKAAALKESVATYNRLKFEEGRLKKEMKRINGHVEFIIDMHKKITGNFPDGIFPLFNQPESGR